MSPSVTVYSHVSALNPPSRFQRNLILMVHDNNCVNLVSVLALSTEFHQFSQK
jgi:hypothetical protein